MPGTIPRLTVIPGEHHTPELPDPSLAEAFAVISEEAYDRGWNECLAYVLRGAPCPLRVVDR